jgi:hypothetical protein
LHGLSPHPPKAIRSKLPKPYPWEWAPWISPLASRKRPKVVALLLLGRVAQVTRGKYRLPAFQIGPFSDFCRWMKGPRNELSEEPAGGQRPLLAAPKLVHMTAAEREDAARLLAAMIRQIHRIHGGDRQLEVPQDRHLAATLPIAPSGIGNSNSPNDAGSAA